MPESYLNYIQLGLGIAAAVFIFIGIFLSVKKLNPEKYETIPMKTTVISIPQQQRNWHGILPQKNIGLSIMVLPVSS